MIILEILSIWLALALIVAWAMGPALKALGEE